MVIEEKKQNYIQCLIKMREDKKSGKKIKTRSTVRNIVDIIPTRSIITNISDLNTSIKRQKLQSR